MRVVRPPAEPLEAFEGPWEPIEAKLGMTLPSDYKELVRVYGSGCFMDFVWLRMPRGSDGGAMFLEDVRQVAHAFRVLPLPYPLWPDPSGLIPIGATGNDDRLFLLPGMPPQSWSTVVWDRGGEEHRDTQTFDCDITDFLAGLMTRDIVLEFMPDDVTDRTFEPVLI